ncbi:MAG: type II secretion system F family protein, partial [Alphaproteobacteria bacterium]|nr:type II secretion system F family protein [Alphaproteobacteria bacterium]
MPAFLYRAVHPSGRVQKGTIVAANENELVAVLDDAGLELIEAKTCKPSFSLSLYRRSTQTPSLRERLLLCGQLRDLLQAGVPFLQALQILLDSSMPERLRAVTETLARSIRHGSHVAAAFTQHPGLFSPVFIALLVAGEESGDLAATFDRLTHYLERQLRFQTQLRRALRYPLFLLALALGVTTFMMTLVVPQVVGFLNSLSNELPFLTRLLVGTAGFFADAWAPALLFLLVGSFAIVAGRRSHENFASLTDSWFLALPGLGNVARQLSTARFATSLAVLLRCGVSLPASLHIAAAVLGNRVLTTVALEAEQRLLAGQTFSAATHNLFPPTITQRLRVGEQSGRLTQTLEN